MKKFLKFGFLSWLLLPQVGRATDLYYTNGGTVTFPPQIDAVNFINNGIFDFGLNLTVQPFDTSNTQNFTNNGTMVGASGFRFDNAPNIGPRKLATSFRNRLAGRITALDTPGFVSQTGAGIPIDTQLVLPSFLLVAATNVINEGVLTAGAAGLMRLVGTNVNVARSGLQIEPITAQGSGPVNTNYFLPDVAIYDRYWGQTNQVMNSANIILSSSRVVSPFSAVDFHVVPPFIRIFGFARVVLDNPVWGIYTNTLATTNISVTNMTGAITITNVPTTNVVQAGFMSLPATGDISWGVRFFPSSDFRNPFNTISMGLGLNTTNGVTAGPELATIFLVDTLAAETNRGLYTNFISILDHRPQNYTLERATPFEFAFGFSGNAPFSGDLLYKPDYASAIVTNEYAAYSAFVDNIASRPPHIAVGTITNLPGRIEILADTVNLDRARFRAEGLLDIRARHVTSTTNTLVDCENLSYTLGSTNGNLKIQNLAKELVARLFGTNSCWSGLWTNTQNMIIENWDVSDTNAPPKPANITNVVEARIHVLLWNTASMQTELPVFVNTLITHSTNVVVNDHMTVVQSLLIDGTSFTLNGGITLSNTYYIDTRSNTVEVSLDNWIGTNAPNVLFFTNNGTLTIPSDGHFGDDRTIPYSVFVNNGSINAYGQTIKSDFCGIGGRNTTVGALQILTRKGKIEGGSLTAGGDAQFYADDLKLADATIAAGSRLDLTVTNALYDSGGGSGNLITCNDGFRLLRKPLTGDLLGTLVNTVAPEFAEVDHTWAGADRGANKTGFENNTALGRLTPTPGDLEVFFPPLFYFAGTGSAESRNGLYVDDLDLSKLADYQNELAINSDLVIYYAAASLPFTPPPTNGVPQQPEEYLDGQFGGHLRWVKDFAGPFSGTPVVSNGVSIMVNRALRNSLIIDSDGDGIPNGMDFYPFDNALVAKLAVPKQPSLTAVLSWNAVAQKVYSVQFTTNFISPNWQTAMYYTNNAPTNGTVSVQIPVPAGSLRRFYRVGTTPY